MGPVYRGRGTARCDFRKLDVPAIGTRDDFFNIKTAPAGVDFIITNPPYGSGGREAVRFIKHALTLVPRTLMLLRADFDSAVSRVHIFRDEPRFAFKLVLLRRIKWFDGFSSPSDNHCWFGWSDSHRGPPALLYPSTATAPARRARPPAGGASLPARFDQTEQRGNTHATD